MKKRRFYSIRLKLVFLLSVSALIAILLSSVAIFFYTYSKVRVESQNSLLNIANILAKNLTAPIEFDDSKSAFTLLKTLEINKDIQGAYIFLNDNKEFVSYTRDNGIKSSLDSKIQNYSQQHKTQEHTTFIDSDNIIVSSPIYLDKEYIATFYIIATTETLNNNIIGQQIVQFIVVIISLIIITLLAMRLQRIFTFPILKLKEVTDEVSKSKNYNLHVEYESNDEFQSLFNGFNNMIDKVKEQNLILETYTITLNDTIKEKTKAIRKKNKELKSTLKTMDQNVIFSKTDLNGFITHVSQAFCIISGYSQDELIGKSHNVVRHPDMSSEIFQNIWIALKNNACWFGEMKNLRKNGTYYWVYTKIEPEYNSDAEHIGYYAIRQDITDKKRVDDLSANLEIKVEKRTKELEYTKLEIEEIHKHTRDSIEYASLIQSALIPDNELFRKYFKDYFAIWHPKDTVGGDIYLFEDLSEHECLLMVIDCTGHGVPGAFVTMLVKAIERQIVSKIKHEQEDVSPAKLLSVFNQNMKQLLKQEDSASISNAGFDGAILYYNKKEKIIKFAGAQIALFYIEDSEFKMIKGDRYSVGYKKCRVDYDYKEHILDVKEGMQFYITTDGYLDQNGGENGFSFGKTKFKNLIQNSKNESMSDQQEIFLYGLEDYQLDYERNDDVTLLGFKL